MHAQEFMFLFAAAHARHYLLGMTSYQQGRFNHLILNPFAVFNNILLYRNCPFPFECIFAETRLLSVFM